jgi:4-amino-4-deoxy-L-arabinose transferase-like glycosyltransferase
VARSGTRAESCVILVAADQILIAEMNANPSQTGASAADRTGRPALWLVAAAAIVAFVVLGQGITAPFQKDAEPQSAQWVQSVARGHLMAPRDYYGYLVEKPLLYYWLSGAVTRLMGGNATEVSARIVSLLAGTALAIEVLLWTSENLGVAEGWLAFLFLIATYGYSSRATLALTDMLMTFLVISTLLILYPQLDGPASRPRTFAAIVVLQFAVLTKGPIAAVLTGLAVVIYFVITGRNLLALLLERWAWILAIAVVVMTVGWYWLWFTLGTWKIFPIFMTENFGHFLSAKYGGTGEAARPPWYIVARLVGGAMPILLLLPAAIAGFMTGEIGPARRRPLAFQASLAIAVIAFFSIASAKRDDYILPALPGVAILCAAVFVLSEPTAGRARWAIRLRIGAVAVTAIAMLSALAAGIALALTHAHMSLHLQSSDADELALYVRGFATMRLGYLIFALAVIAGAIAAGVGLARRNTILAGAAVGILTLCLSMLANAILRPGLAWERSAKTFAFIVHEQIGAAPIFVAHHPNYDFSFYYGTDAPPLMGRNRQALPPGVQSYLIANDTERNALAPQYRDRLKLVVKSHLVGNDGPLALYAIGPEPQPLH